MAPISRLNRAMWPSARLALLALVATAAGGCSLFSSGDPEEIRVQVEGTSSEPVLVVVSREFLVTSTEGGEDGGVSVQLATADTFNTTLPFDRTFALAPTYRFLARAHGSESGEPLTLRLRVLVDGDERSNQTRTVAEDFLQFIYVFQ